MDGAWRSRVKELFLAARERRPEERAGFLDEACGDVPLSGFWERPRLSRA